MHDGTMAATCLSLLTLNTKSHRSQTLVINYFAIKLTTEIQRRTLTRTRTDTYKHKDFINWMLVIAWGHIAAVERRELCDRDEDTETRAYVQP